MRNLIPIVFSFAGLVALALFAVWLTSDNAECKAAKNTEIITPADIDSLIYWYSAADGGQVYPKPEPENLNPVQFALAWCIGAACALISVFVFISVHHKKDYK